MAPSPVPVLAIVTLTLVFEALLFGGAIAHETFKAPEEPPAIDCTGFFDGAACTINAVLGFFRSMWGVLAFFFALLTFDVPGAPWFIRLLVGTFVTGATIWSVASLIRGGS